jgi:hypothetical protein
MEGCVEPQHSRPLPSPDPSVAAVAGGYSLMKTTHIHRKDLRQLLQPLFNALLEMSTLFSER